METTIKAEQELIRYSNEIGYGSLPYLVSNTIYEIRKLFADTITKDIEIPLDKQVQNLLFACQGTQIEFENYEVFDKDNEDIGILRIQKDLRNPTTDNEMSLTVDVFFSIQLHDMDKESTDENSFLACPYYADVIIEDYDKGEEVTIQDINGNELAIMLRGEDVKLQINTVEVDERGKTFVYDGCHKIYILTTDEDKARAVEYGYIVEGSNSDSECEHPISEIEDYYLKSCPLRFISYFDLDRTDYSIIEQFTDCPMFIYH